MERLLKAWTTMLGGVLLMVGRLSPLLVLSEPIVDCIVVVAPVMAHVGSTPNGVVQSPEGSVDSHFP